MGLLPEFKRLFECLKVELTVWNELWPQSETLPAAVVKRFLDAHFTSNGRHNLFGPASGIISLDMLFPSLRQIILEKYAHTSLSLFQLT